MTALAQEAARLVDSLPQDKAQALIEYARYLAEKCEDENWERRFASSEKFKSFAQQMKQEIEAGTSEPLDLKKL